MPDFQRLRILYPDTFGFARGKYVPAAAATGEMSYSVTIFGVAYNRGLVPTPGASVLDGMGDMKAVYDPETARSWWQESVGIVIADLERAGAPLDICPRHALRRAIADLEALGYQPDVGAEVEAYVLQPDGNDGWEPWNTPSSYCYGTGPVVDPIGLLDEIMDKAQIAGIPIETAASEYDTPQFELTVRYRDALTAIDDVFLLKLLCREVAIGHGLLLTFLGRPLGDRGGNGLHVNISLRDASGHNALADPEGPDGLADVTRHAVAGILAHHEALAAPCAPTVNAYKRLVPGQLSGYWANWGHDHRSVAVRVPADRYSGTRIESRLPDGAANPYLATAALLQAARLGIEHELEPPDPETGDGLESANTDRCVPENLSAALDALEADTALIEAVGPALVEHFVAMKREEWGRFAAAVTDWEIAEYLTLH